MKKKHDTLPHNVEAEQGVLSSMMIDPSNTIPEVVERMGAEQLFVPAHVTIFNELVSLWTAQKGIDMITFTNHLRDKGLLDSVGGVSFVTNLFLFVPTAANVRYYLDIVRDKYILRQIIAAGTEGVRRAYEDPGEVDALLDELLHSYQSIPAVDPAVDDSIRPHIMAKIDHMENGVPDDDLIPTGLVDLDEKSPLKKGDMPLIMGKRKCGKSILALTIAQNIARKGTGVLIFSLEDRTPKLTDRLIAGATRIPMWKNHTSKLDDKEIATWMTGATKLMDLPIWIRDDCFDLRRITAAVRQARRKRENLGVVIVDYAQLIRGGVSRNSTREQEVANVSRTLRLLAMETGIAHIVLSQENKDGESRESRALEQDATAGWRLEFSEDDPKIRKLYIPWQRNGDSGCLVDVAFMGDIARFENLSQRES